MARTVRKQSSSRWNRDLILSKTFHPICMLSAIVGSFVLLAAASKRTEAEPPIRVATVGLVHGHVKGFFAALRGNPAATLVAIVEPQEPLAKALCRHWGIPRGHGQLDDFDRLGL